MSLKADQFPFNDLNEKMFRENAMNTTPDTPIDMNGNPPIKADGGGLRYDAGKNLLDLIPPEWVWALGMILTKGAKKYAARNWERGMKYSKVMGPLKRHLTKYEAGEQYDYGTPDEPGTNCHHLAIVAWNALALMSYELRGIGEDDLPNYDFSILAKTVDDANGIQHVKPAFENHT